MTNETSHTTNYVDATAGGDLGRVNHSPEQAGPPNPVPEQRPWVTEEGTQGWRTVCRGVGQRRQFRSSVVVESTSDQRVWLDRAGKAAGLLRHQLIAKLIDDARLADAAEQVEPTYAAK